MTLICTSQQPTKMKHVRLAVNVCLQLFTSSFHQSLLTFLVASTTHTLPSKYLQSYCTTNRQFNSNSTRGPRSTLFGRTGQNVPLHVRKFTQSQRQDKSDFDRKLWSITKCFYWEIGIHRLSTTGHLAKRKQCWQTLIITSKSVRPVPIRTDHRAHSHGGLKWYYQYHLGWLSHPCTWAHNPSTPLQWVWELFKGQYNSSRDGILQGDGITSPHERYHQSL